MGINWTSDSKGGSTASLDTVVECGQSHALGLSWLTLRDDRGNSVMIFLPREMVRRLHETWAATAPVDRSDLARTVS